MYTLPHDLQEIARSLGFQIKGYKLTEIKGYKKENLRNDVCRISQDMRTVLAKKYVKKD